VDFLAVQGALAAKGYTFISAEIAYIALTEAALTDEEDVKKMERLLEMLEDNDDIQSVWHNWQES
jgi:transcriptional/translational regulatory protein YebC/TACO1